MFRGNPAHTGVARAPSKIAAAPRLAWTYKSGEGPLESSAAITGGIAYLGTGDGQVIALDLDSGRLLRKHTLQSGAAFRASPTVAGGRVYLGDEGGIFHAFSADLKKELWSLETDAEIVSSATLVDGKILFGSYDGRLYCLDGTGKVLWKFESDQPLHATPTLAGGAVLIAGCDGFLRAIEIASGKEISQADMGGYSAATPAVVSGTAFVGTFNNQVIAVDWRKGKLVWSYEHPRRNFPFYASPAVAGDRVIAAGRDKMVHALHRETGKSLWTFSARGRMDSSPVICGETIFVGAGDGVLYGIDLSSGKERWRYTGGAPILASPAVADGRLVIGADDGRIYCFDLRVKGVEGTPEPEKKTSGSGTGQKER